MEKPEVTGNAKPQIAFNWTTPEPSHDMDEEILTDIAQDDLTPSILEQAKLNGWNCEYYSFGTLDGQGTEFFNTGIIERPDGLWLLTRASGQHPQGFMYGQNSIIAFKLADSGKQPCYGKVLSWPVGNPQQHFEDPRGIYHAALGQTLIGCCTFLWNGPGDWTGPHQAFGAFDEEWNCKKMDYPKIGGNPGSMEKIQKHSDYEKNWLWFIHAENLVLLYKANPWKMFIFGNRWSEKEEIKGEGVTWPYGEIRGGTTPVKVGDYYFTFHHSSLPWKGRYRRYYAGCLAFDAKPPFTPRLITAEPLLIGSQNDTWAQRKPLVVFPCGAIIKDETWLITLGVNDMVSAWLEVPHQDLLKRMVPIEQVSDTIFSDYGLPEHKKFVNKHLSVGVESRHAVRCAEDTFLIPKEETRSSEKVLTPPIGSSDPNAQKPSKKKRKPFSPEALQNLRNAAAKARAARMAKREASNVIGGAMKEVWESGVRADYEKFREKNGEPPLPKRRKRRRKRFKRITAEARQKALKEYEASKS